MIAMGIGMFICGLLSGISLLDWIIEKDPTIYALKPDASNEPTAQDSAKK